MSRLAFNEALITEVEKRPLLWNTRLEDYRNRDRRLQLWEEVADVLRALMPDGTFFCILILKSINATVLLIIK